MNFIRVAAISGAISVILGAFGAHTLKSVLDPALLQAFETGVRYQFYHSLALLLCGILEYQGTTKALRMAGGSFLAGILFFSGSLYLLSTRSILGIEGMSWLGPITPIGGILFVAGWLFLFSHSRKSENKTGN